MLGKLLKYDFKAAKIVLPFYAVSALLLVILYALFSFDLITNNNVFMNIIVGFLSVLCVFSFMGVMIISMVYAVLHFGKHTIGAQAQTMFTLPVTAGQFLISKLISALTVILAAFAYFVLCIFAFAFAMDGFEMYVDINFGAYEIGFFITLFILTVSSIAFSLLLYYLSVALSRLISQNRVMGTIAAYLVLSFVIQMLLVFIIAIIGAVAYSMGIFNNIGLFAADNNILLNPLLVLGGFALVFVGIDAIMFAICHNQFSKKLNLP